MMTMNNGLETKKWEDLGLRPTKSHANPSLSELDYKTLHIPGSSGELDFGTEIGSRNGFEIPLKVLASEERNLTIVINQINRFFFDEFKQPRYIKTIFDYEPNKYVWLKVASSYTPNRSTILKELSIPFVQFDDNKYSVLEADEIVWGNKVVDFTADYLLGNTGSGAKDMLITRNTTIRPFLEGLALQPYFELKGSGTNVKVACGGKTITIGTFNDATVSVDCENYLIYVNGVESDFSMDDFYLIPGQPVTITGSNMNFKLTLHYRDIYL